MGHAAFLRSQINAVKKTVKLLNVNTDAKLARAAYWNICKQMISVFPVFVNYGGSETDDSISFFLFKIGDWRYNLLLRRQ